MGSDLRWARQTGRGREDKRAAQGKRGTLMRCSRCGTQNPENANYCLSCGNVLPPRVPTGAPVLVKTSGLAIAAFVLGILSLFTLGLLALPAIIVGIIALGAISRSGGRLTGTGFAVVGIVVPVFSFLFIGLLLAILMPALARTRQLAFRMTCGTNLSGIGKAMIVYAGDYNGELPRAGGHSSTWGPVADWTAPNRRRAYNIDPATDQGGTATISSCFYLLVKYAEVTPKSFICKGDAGTTEFKLADLQAGTVSPTTELIDLWDFGPTIPEASKRCSYSYHVPFGLYALTTSGEPGFAVAADRNPWINSPGADAKVFPGTGTELFRPDIQGYGGSNDQARNGNAITHQNDGQNVLFLDSHVAFEKRPYCSVGDDNIYTLGDKSSQGSAFGTAPVCTSQPQARRDAVLIHDDYKTPRAVWFGTGNRSPGSRLE
jgi:hypothetical protein